jgi:hypothetical protein
MACLVANASLTVSLEEYDLNEGNIWITYNAWHTIIFVSLLPLDGLGLVISDMRVACPPGNDRCMMMVFMMIVVVI